MLVVGLRREGGEGKIRGRSFVPPSRAAWGCSPSPDPLAWDEADMALSLTASFSEDWARRRRLQPVESVKKVTRAFVRRTRPPVHASTSP